MDKGINNNGYDYVDLGLPSGTLWATCNVGANKPTDFGLYFQWGDTIGYIADQVGNGGGKKYFSWSDYKFSIDGSYSNFSKYTTTGATLDLEDDAANVNMGGDWHMPTPDQISELINGTTSTCTQQDGVYGRLFTSKNGNSIFIPAVGCARDGSLDDVGSSGYVWSSVLSSSNVYYGQYLYFSSGDAYLFSYFNRRSGLSVRGVIDKKFNDSKDKKNNMKDEPDLAEILKGVPKGTKLWSPICGECEFVGIEDDLRPIHCTYKRNIINTQFDSYSETNIFFANDESVLFPSKDNKDWSTFKASKGHKHFEPYQKVLIRDWFCSKSFWVAALYGHYDTLTNKHYLIGSDWAEDDDIIPYKGNEDKLGEIIKK